MDAKAKSIVIIASILWIYLLTGRHNLTDLEKLAFLDVPEIIKIFGYSVEQHSVVTDDGYFLTLHRIPGSRSNVSFKGPVIIQHGFLQSSADFIMLGPENALPFLLADAGYDVWLGNSRGNYYSKKHKKFSQDDKQYWDFSLHDVAIYDTSKVIDYVLKESGSDDLSYIGFSFGGSQPFALVSERPEYNEKMKVVITLAPGNYPAMDTTPLHHVFFGAKKYMGILASLSVHYAFIRRYIYADIARAFCSDGKITQSFCLSLVSIATGSDERNVNTTLFPVVLGHFPSGSSLRAFAHVGQVITSGEFHAFDYGALNSKYYGRDSPPYYNFKNFNSKVVLFCGSTDNIVPCKNVNRIFSQIPQVRDKTFYVLENVTHLDFTYGSLVRKQLYEGILEILDSS